MWSCGKYRFFEQTGEFLSPAGSEALSPAGSEFLSLAGSEVASPTKEAIIMGILNVTPDSFSDGGAHTDPKKAIAFGREMIAHGADIIDIGGESSRPGAIKVTDDEEMRRILPVVYGLAEQDVPVSVDTRNARTARAAIDAGAVIINDITGFSDPKMIEVAASTNTGLVVMHMQGTPGNMQNQPRYEDVVREVGEWLSGQARKLEARGVSRQRICLDVGPGFGKTLEHNMALLKATGEMAKAAKDSGYQWMAAWSRKSFVGAICNEEKPRQRVAGSVAVACYAVAFGATVVRVHDVAATAQALKALQAIL